MKAIRIMLVIVSVLMLTTSCKNVYLYGNSSSFPHDTTPTMVFFDDQVMSLAPKTYPQDRWIFVEYTSKTGAFVKGRLLEVTDTDLVVSRGHFQEKSDDSVIYEDVYDIGKNEIMVLKVWNDR